MSALLRPLAPWIALALLAAVLVTAGPAACRKIRGLEAERRLAVERKDAATASGADAVETVGSAAARERASDTLSDTNEREIRYAQGADVRVDDRATAAGIDGLCRRAAYRDSERCRLRGAASR